MEQGKCIAKIECDIGVLKKQIAKIYDKKKKK